MGLGIKDKVKRLLQKRMFKRVRNNVVLPPDNFYNVDFDVDIRHGIEGKKYLTVGHGCILGGRYTFERETGQIRIGDRVHVGPGSTLISMSDIEIEDDVLIAWNVLLYDNNAHSIYWEERKNDVNDAYECVKNGKDALSNKDWSTVKTAPIKICSKAWICANCTVLKGVTIGEGAIVAAGSVVTKDVEPWTLVAGNPAEFKRKLEPKRGE